MKSIGFTLCLCLLMFCCKSPEKKVSEKNSKTSYFIQEFETNGRDTINKTDNNGLKQGHWVYYMSYHNPNNVTTIEEGDYVNNRKQGIWTYYDSTGKVTRTVKFNNDRAQ